MIKSIRGTKDYLPDSTPIWRFVEDVFRKTSSEYGYGELRFPIFEKTGVFSRSIGEETDIVNKEMYTFYDRSGESITLRPEGTAGLVRSVIENSLHKSSPLMKLWYSGPFFRYERPQKGRLRQFHQYGAECVGSPNPESDAENILLANDIIKRAGLKDYNLILNTLGSDKVRTDYKIDLMKFLDSVKDKLSKDSQRRLETNPLRVLDSKAPEDKEQIEKAPSILDYLDVQSSEHFETVKELISGEIDNLAINPLLVRGLDYYCHTVFEFQSSALGAQDSFGGGGRYDGLFQRLGGKEDLPAVGFALGVERLLLALEKTNQTPKLDDSPDVFVIVTNWDNAGVALKSATAIRRNNYKVVFDLTRKSVKAQFRQAGKSGAKYAIVLGDEELKEGKATVKNMSEGEQSEINLDKIAEFNFGA